MIKRPLCFICLVFIIIQGLILSMKSGQSLVEVPASSIFQEAEGQIILAGQVYDKQETGTSQTLFLKNNSISYQNNQYYDSKIMVYDRDFHKISIGQFIYIEGTTAFFDTAHNPGNFDQQLYYARDHIYGAVFGEKISVLKGEEDSFREKLYQFKMTWKKKLLQELGEKNGNILAAMLLGEKSEMDADLKELYQKNGIGHVLAISGLHISFIGLGMYGLIRKTGLSFVLSGLLALSILSVYAVMIGFSVSVFRAYVMLLLKIVADVTGRVYDMMTGLFLAAAITVGKQPLYLTDAGFYLSYGAIIGILLILPAIKKHRWGEKRWLEGFLSGLAVNAALFPIQLWYYYEFPLYSILLNMLVIPLMSILLGAGMIGSLFLFVMPWAGSLLLRVCDFILNSYEKIGEIGICLPGSRLVMGQPDLWEIGLYYLALFLILSGISKVKYGLGVGILSIVLLLAKPFAGLQITMIDVGQGDGILVKEARGITCFIDGGSSDVKEVGKYRIEPFLKSQGIGVLDYVFISHGDADHYSGIEELLQRQKLGIPIENLVIPENYREDANLINLAVLAKKQGVQVSVFKKGNNIQGRKLVLTCLQPGLNDHLSGNAGSMVLDVSYQEFDLLLTGDVEAEGEALLMGNLQRTYDVLKVAHHGSKYSSEEAFLNQISPQIALISSGKENAYGHPHKEVLERLEKRNIRIYQTAQSGAVTLKINGKKISIDVFH